MSRNRILQFCRCPHCAARDRLRPLKATLEAIEVAANRGIDDDGQLLEFIYLSASSLVEGEEREIKLWLHVSRAEFELDDDIPARTVAELRSVAVDLEAAADRIETAESGKAVMS